MLASDACTDEVLGHRRMSASSRAILIRHRSHIQGSRDIQVSFPDLRREKGVDLGTRLGICMDELVIER